VAPTTARGQHTVAGGSDESTVDKSIQYPEGQSHGVTVYVQLNDDNALYESLTDAQRDLNNERGENGTSDNPHYLGTIDASWTDGQDEIGFFSSGARYGKETDSGVTQFYKQHLNLYDDVSEAKKSNNPAKREIRVHKRSDELVYTKDGNEFSWPAGWQTGHQHEGTLLKIQASYIRQLGEAIADAFELIEATDLLSGSELRQVKDPITETLRFSGLETHHRFHKNHEKDAINTLRDSARLVATEGSGKEQATIEKGHHQIYAFRNDRIDFLGFDTSIEWEYRGETYTDTIDQHYLKVYRHKNAELFPNSDPRAHPKIEVKADSGAFPAPAWDSVKKHLDTILNAHTADLAGVPKSGLVEDMYHDGSNQEEIVTQSPANYRINLQDYFKSTGLKKDIISLLVNNRTDSAKDILYTLIRLGRPLTYDELKEETGLTKGTIQKWVRELEDLAIVYRERDAVVVDHHTQSCMFISMTDYVREHLRGFIEKMKPAGDVKRAIKRRKQERIEARESTSESTSNTEAIATDGGVNHPPENKSTETQSVDSQDTPAIADRPPD
jgi:predicted transcriptional regulator